jgi:g-D-glutamyl-meso-diaminopimelate peptidase
MEANNIHFVYDSKRLQKAIAHLKRAYPFISVSSIGSSVLGNPIYELKMGNGAKKIHMNASFHANEWITTVTLMNLISSILFSFKNRVPFLGNDLRNTFNHIELSIVPMVNPDGVDLVLNGPPLKFREKMIKINQYNDDDFIHWKANIHGVDLNKQFPANWQEAAKIPAPQSPSFRDYPGIAPLTEPEAVAMANLVQSNHFDLLFAFHTQGEEFYWGYEGFEPPESFEMAMKLEQESGYKAVQNAGSHAGLKDWFIQEFRKPGFTLELGKGINPLPMSQFNKILRRAERLFLAGLFL